MKKVLLFAAAVFVFALGIAVAALGNSSSSQTTTTLNNAHNKITICHATGSKTNPYVVITPDAGGVIDGHYAHQDKRDIIPAFDYYTSDKVLHHFPGQNLANGGQAILNNGCKVPKPGTTTGITTGPGGQVTTVTVTTTVPTTGPGSTTTVTKTVSSKKAVKTVVKKVHVRGVVSHKVPKSTG